MAINIKRFIEGIRIFPKSGSTISAQGELEVDSATTKLNFHNGSSASPIVTEVHASQGTNRLKDKDLEAGSTKLVDASDTTKKVAFDLSGATGSTTATIISSATANRSITLPDATDTLVGKATSDVLTNKTFDADGTGNSITNIENADIKSGAAIARNKLASGTASHVLINDGSGVMSSEAALAVSRGGTNSATALNNNRIMQSSGSAIVEASAITASRALVSDANGIPTHTAVTTTELGYVSGVTSAIQTQLNAIVALTFPSGVILPYGGSGAPDANWLLCYGQAVNRTTYSTLFTAIGTTYGVGDGATTFNLPDLRGRVVAGKDDMGGSAASRITNAVSGFDGTSLGAAGGSQSHTLITAEMPSHTHTQDAHNHAITDAGHTHKLINATGSGTSGNHVSVGATSVNPDSGTLDMTTDVTGITINNATATNQNTGGDGAHRNVQPTMILNYIIKV